MSLKKNPKNPQKPTINLSGVHTGSVRHLKLVKPSRMAPPAPKLSQEADSSGNQHITDDSLSEMKKKYRLRKPSVNFEAMQRFREMARQKCEEALADGKGGLLRQKRLKTLLESLTDECGE